MAKKLEVINGLSVKLVEVNKGCKVIGDTCYVLGDARYADFNFSRASGGDSVLAWLRAA